MEKSELLEKINSIIRQIDRLSDDITNNELSDAEKREIDKLFDNMECSVKWSRGWLY